MGCFPFGQKSQNFGLAVNGKCFLGLFHWLIPGKSGKSKKVDEFSQLERSERNFMSNFYLSDTLYQFQLLPIRQPSWCPVRQRAWRRTWVYDQMKQLFTQWKIHFCPHQNFRMFYLNDKYPRSLNTSKRRHRKA